MVKIYKITSPTGRIYIGQTKNFRNRMTAYRSLSCKKQRFLYNSLKRHGFNAHKVEILAEVEQDRANDAEIYYISTHKSFRGINPKGMNLTTGGKVYEVSYTTKSRISNALLGKKNVRAKKLYQYTLSGELVKIWHSMMDINREYGYHVTALSHAAKTNGSGYGYVWSYKPIEFTEYIRNKGGVSGKSILQLSLDGNVIAKFDSILQASKQTGISREAIKRYLQNKPIYKVRVPYKWAYTE